MKKGRRIFFLILFLAIAGIGVFAGRNFAKFSEVRMEAYEGNNTEDYADYDKTLDSNACTRGHFSKDELFGTEEEDIVYSQVEQIKPIALLSDKDSRTHHLIKYNAFLVQLKVLSGVYGDLEAETEVWALAGRAYRKGEMNKGAKEQGKGCQLLVTSRTFRRSGRKLIRQSSETTVPNSFFSESGSSSSINSESPFMADPPLKSS